jgi:hypothetical protein
LLPPIDAPGCYGFRHIFTKSRAIVPRYSDGLNGPQRQDFDQSLTVLPPLKSSKRQTNIVKINWSISWNTKSNIRTAIVLIVRGGAL